MAMMPHTVLAATDPPSSKRLGIVVGHLQLQCVGSAIAVTRRCISCAAPTSTGGGSSSDGGSSSSGGSPLSNSGGLTDEELYLFDTMGFLKVEGMLDRDTAAQAYASSQIIMEQFDHHLENPIGKAIGGDKYRNAFLFDKVLERIPHTERMMKYVCNVTNNQPRLVDGTLMVQTAKNPFNNFHLRKDIDSEIAEDGPRFYTDIVNHRIYADYVTFFVYLTDVNEGDGGLLVVPGSHRSSFKYPPELFYKQGDSPQTVAQRQKLGFVNVSAKAGDAIIMPLRLNHAVMPWLPQDRDRRVMFYQYKPQYWYAHGFEQHWFRSGDTAQPAMDEPAAMRHVAQTEGVELDAETLELVAMREKAELKNVVKNHLAKYPRTQ